MFREAGLSLGGGARSSSSGAAAASRPKESAEVRTSNWCEAPRTPALRSSQEELERDADERVALVTVLSLLAPPPRPRDVYSSLGDNVGHSPGFQNPSVPARLVYLTSQLGTAEAYWNQFKPVVQKPAIEEGFKLP